MYQKLVLVTCIVAFCAIVFSAYARLNDAGLGCDNWPACYSENSLKLRQPLRHDAARSHTSWQWKLQNQTGLLLGILSVLMCGISWKKRGELGMSPALPTVLLALMIFLGVFGALAFSYLPRPIIVQVHLAGGILILILLTWIALRQIDKTPMAIKGSSRFLVMSARIGLALVLTEVMLGGWVSSNFAAMACTEFPLCQGSLVPEMDFSYSFVADGLPLSLETLTAIHWMHRAGAAATLAYSLWFSWRLSSLSEFRTIGRTLAVLVVLQTLIGVLNVKFGLPLATVVLHNALAMVLLVTLTILNFKVATSCQNFSKHY